MHLQHCFHENVYNLVHSANNFLQEANQNVRIKISSSYFEASEDCSTNQNFQITLAGETQDFEMEFWLETFSTNLTEVIEETFAATRVKIPQFETELGIASFTPEIYAAKDYYLSVFNTDLAIYISVNQMQL